MKKEARKKQKRKEKSKKCTILLRKITLLPTQKVGGATSPAHPLGVRTLTLPIQKVERERPYFIKRNELNWILSPDFTWAPAEGLGAQ